MTDYIIYYRPVDTKNWKLDTMGRDVPSDLQGAAELLTYLRDEMGDGYEFKVCLAACVDVTSGVEVQIECIELQENRDAELDAAHIRSESMPGVFL